MNLESSVHIGLEMQRPEPGPLLAGLYFFARDTQELSLCDGTQWLSAPLAMVFGPSGTAHSIGAVPDPGETASATRYLREDGTWAIPASGSGSIVHSYIGNNTPGTAFQTVSSQVTIATQVVLPTAGIITSLGGYIRLTNSDGVMYLAGYVAADNAGSPGNILGACGFTQFALGTQAGWLQLPIGLYVPDGTYWLCLMDYIYSRTWDIGYAAGADKLSNTSGAWLQSDTGWAVQSQAYSIRADFIA